MKLRKIAQVALVAASILAIGACSTSGKHGSGNGAYGANGSDMNGVEAGGAGDSENFGGGVNGRNGSAKNTYYFDYDSNVVHDEDKPRIFANADYLVAHSNARVTVEGHTDPRGSREYNVALGERRGNAVAELLREKGAASRQVQVVSYGAERLASPGHSEEDFRLDRRAVIVYQQK